MTEPTDTIDVEARDQEFDGGFDDDVKTKDGDAGEAGKPAEKAETAGNEGEAEGGFESGDKDPAEQKPDPAKPETPAKEKDPPPETTKTLEDRATAAAEAKQSEIDQRNFLNEIKQIDPEILEVAGSEEFQTWLTKQSDVIKAAAYQNKDVPQALAVFNMFKNKPADKPTEKEVQAAFQKELGDDFFGEFKMTKDNGDEKTLSEVMEEYGEVGVMLRQSLKAIYAKLAGAVGGSDTPTDLLDRLNTIDSKVSDLSRWGQVQQQHPDARTILQSPEYDAWMKGQSKIVQSFAQSQEPADIIAILDQYKQDSVGKGLATAKGKQEAARKKTSALLKSSLKGGAGSSEGTGTDDENDYEAGFNG